MAIEKLRSTDLSCSGKPAGTTEVLIDGHKFRAPIDTGADVFLILCHCLRKKLLLVAIAYDATCGKCTVNVHVNVQYSWRRDNVSSGSHSYTFASAT